jgi:CDP-diacylglycerol---serine O-phosphatidyltransferase
LPSPAAAALLAGFVWVSYEYNVDGREIFFGALQMKWIAWCITIFAAGSMVSDLRFYSGKDINLKASVPFVAVLAIMLAFVLISYSPPEVLFTVVFVYSLSGYYLWIKQKIRKET